MIRPRFLNIVFYIFLRHLIFYIFMMIKNNRLNILNANNFKSIEDIIYYILIFLPLPLISIILSSVPIYLTFKKGNVITFFMTFSIVFLIEYSIYTYLASEADPLNGIYYILIGFLLLLILFYKSIKLIFTKRVR